MNEFSQYIFDISHVNRNLRDTLEFILPKEVSGQVYDNRKRVVASVLDSNTFLGKFIANNAEQTKEFTKNYQEFLDEVYGESSTVLTKTAEGNIRVDHAQHIVILRGVVYLGETIRDIMFSHYNKAKQDNIPVQELDAYIDADERFDRIIKIFLLLQEYQKSFMEFQKVMTESKGQQTPQSNYIVQNELNVLANMIRFTRAHCHFIDNKTLDTCDRVVQLIEMCEGKRERRDGKSFPDLFKASLDEFAALANEYGPKFDNLFRTSLAQVMEAINKAKEKKGDNNDA